MGLQATFDSEADAVYIVIEERPFGCTVDLDSRRHIDFDEGDGRSGSSC